MCSVSLRLHRIFFPKAPDKKKSLKHMAWLLALIIKYLPLAPVPLWLRTVALCGAIYLLLEKQFALKRA